MPLVHFHRPHELGISWGPLLTPGPWAVPKFSNGQSAPEWYSVPK
ncbi:unnamed protein product [Staurois parvus]|uniref:Uncharacterized protein n=1 Tax=Staurois parvus TaxID=386267 RepID=A0ABN9G562_9NEOB|nr:unnamed protein product [Staurois parvus]